MAHFAKLDDNNIVLEVHVVNNEVLDSNNEEASGIEFLTEWSGGYSNWKQTSYNGNFRKKMVSNVSQNDILIFDKNNDGNNLDYKSYLNEISNILQSVDTKLPRY